MKNYFADLEGPWLREIGCLTCGAPIHFVTTEGFESTGRETRVTAYHGKNKRFYAVAVLTQPSALVSTSQVREVLAHLQRELAEFCREGEKKVPPLVMPVTGSLPRRLIP